MQSKHDEIIITTSDISEMKDLFLAERLLRTWKEDFVDEDTGDVVEIERNEIIFEKGTKMNHDNLSQINFLLQSGDIKEVKLSNQERKSYRVVGYGSLWQVTISLNQKKKTIYLYANSVEMAIEISTDYIEQMYEGRFDFKNIKELDYSNLLCEKEEGFEDEELDVYKMEIELLQDDEKYESTYIVHGTDAENCKKIIEDFITKQRIESKEVIDFELKIISAKTIPVNYLIEPEFCKKYLKEL